VPSDTDVELSIFVGGVTFDDLSLIRREPGSSLNQAAGASPMQINDPAVVAEVRAVFDRYEAALMANDTPVLDEIFWADPRTVRFGYNASPFRHLAPGFRVNQYSAAGSFSGGKYKVNWDNNQEFFTVLSPPFSDPAPRDCHPV
jgi:hypothetical protein